MGKAHVQATSLAVLDTQVSAAKLCAADHAAFAVTSRLFASIVSEALLRAIYVPMRSEHCAGLCVVLSSRARPDYTAKDAANVFAILPLHHKPMLKDSIHNFVWLLDPLDMLPAVFFFGNKDVAFCQELLLLPYDITSCLRAAHWNVDTQSALKADLSPQFWWTRFATNVSMHESLRESLFDEILSSSEWQKVAFDKPPRLPTLHSPAIEWEQSIVEGHPTHPMSRARCALPPLRPVTPADRDWYHPRVRFAVVPRARLDIRGDFEATILELALATAARRGTALPWIPTDCAVMPVYDLQVANLHKMFPEVQILPEVYSVHAQAQASLRTVVVPDCPLALKLAVGIKVSSALRTISHFTADFGPRFSNEIVPRLAIDANVLHVEREVASAVCMRDTDGRRLDDDVVKHFSAMLREPYVPQDDEVVVLAAALSETGHANAPTGVSAVQQILGLDTRDKRTAFFDEYTRLLVAAFVPPLLHNGVAFEAHPQNTLVRISRSTQRVRGLVIRDLGGLRVHPDTLRASTGVTFVFLPGHCVAAASLKEAAKKLYHTLVFNHLQRLARALGLHYDGTGWALLRAHLTARVPHDSWLWDAWMGEGAHSVDGKCLLRMKLAGLYRDTVYESFPNLIQFRPAQ